MAASQNLKEVIADALEVWRREGIDAMNPESEYYNLHQDPVVQLLMGAVTHQTGIIRDDIDRLKQELLDVFFDTAAQGMTSLAVPAVAIMKVQKATRVGVTNAEGAVLDESVCFRVGAETASSRAKVPFVPLLRSRVVDAEVVDVTRLSQGRFVVRIAENEALSSLAGLTLYFSTYVGNGDIRILSNGERLSASSLTDFDRLPLIAPLCEGEEAMSYGMQYRVLHNIFDALCCLESTFLVIDDTQEANAIQRENGCIVLELVLPDAPNDFQLRKEDFHLNCVPVANMTLEKVSLSRECPLHKINLDNRTSFLATVSTPGHPSTQLRTVAAERQTVDAWAKRLERILEQYDENHLVFSEQVDARMDASIQQLVSVLRELNKVKKNAGRSLYLVLSDKNVASVEVPCLLTQGTQGNGIGRNAKIECSSSEFDSSRCCFMTQPAGGRDEAENRADINRAARYFLQTTDRIVTRSDIRHFLQFQIPLHFGVASDRIKQIDLRPWVENTSEGFYRRILLVEIHLAANLESCDRMAVALERMIGYRMASLTPVRVSVQAGGR